MRKDRPFGSIFILLLFLAAAFYFQTPKKGFLRGQIGSGVPVAEAGTEETVPTYVTLTEEINYPSVANVGLNAGSNIELEENTTKAVSLAGDVTDNDGCSDLSTIAGVIYLASLDTSCSAESNSCYYDSADTTVVCNTTSCTDGSAEVTCTADLWFHANSGQWQGSILVTDGSNNTAEGASSPAITVEELQTLLVTSTIPYGTVSVQNTSATQSVGVTATGNVAVDCSLSGTDMTSASEGATIVVTQQKHGMSNMEYVSLDSTLTGTNAAAYLPDISKPDSHPADQIDVTYWGIEIPVGSVNATDYGGTNTFVAATATARPCNGTTSFTYEGTSYDTVAIGSQCWMAESLNVGSMVNSTVDQGTSCSNIDKYCYDDLTSNCNTYGGLYQWDQATCATSSTLEPSGVQGICPSGWHIPSHHEFTTLERTICSDIGNSSCDVTFPKDYSTTGFLGQDTTTAEGEGSALAGNEGLWTDGDIDNSGAGNNDFAGSGFDGLPAGERTATGGFYNERQRARFWSASDSGPNAWVRYLLNSYTNISREYIHIDSGFSVRCLRD